MRMTPWLTLFSKSPPNRKLSSAQKKRRAPAIDRLECLEERVVLATFTVPGTHTTIQAALDAAFVAVGDDTINVGAGTFNENLNITSSVTLNGANAGVAAGVGAGVRGAETIINGALDISAASVNTTINGFQISGGTQNGGGFHGVRVNAGANTVNVINNKIYGNGVLSNTQGIEAGSGLSVQTYQNNEIKDFASGVYVNPGSNAHVLGNYIHNVTAGVGNDSNTLEVKFNRIENAVEGVGLGGSTSIVVQSNSFDFATVTNLIAHYNGANTVDANGNWWGSTNATAIAGKMLSDGAVGSSKVDFSPFLSTGTDASPGTAGFQGSFNALTAHTLGAGATTTRISEANTALTTPGTISVLGSFTEAVNLGAPDNAVALAAVSSLTGIGAGQVTLTGLTLTGNDSLPIEINGTNPATNFDNFIVNGTVTLGSATLNLNVGTFPVTDGQEFVLIANDLADPVGGTFSNYPLDGAIVSTNFAGSGKTARISYFGGTGNDVAIKVDQPNVVVTPPNPNNVDDTFVLRLVGNTLQVVRTSPAPDLVVSSVAFASVQSLTFNGTTDDDTLTVDFAGGNPIPPGGIFFNGGVGGNDTLAVIGTNAQIAVYTPSGTITGNGVVTVGGLPITFTGLEPVDLTAMLTATLALPTPVNVFDVAEGVNGGALASLNVTGTTNAVAIEAPRFRNNTTMVIDTTGSAGADTITITSANNAHGNTNIAINTGTGADVLTVNGVTTVAGTFTATVPTVNLNNDITAPGGISGSATTVNVGTANGIIQDGVDLTGPNATVNIAAESYAEAVTTAARSVTLSPGAGAVAAVTGLTGLVLDGNDRYAVQATANGVNDSITTASVTLGGATLVPTVGYAASLNDVYSIMTVAGAITGEFAGLPEGGIVVSGATRMRISYGVEVPGQITLHVVQAAVNVKLQNGSLFLDGSGAADNFVIEITGTNSVMLRGNEALPALVTNFTGTGINGTFVGPFIVTGDIVVNGGNGNDRITLIGLGGATLDSGNLIIDLGSGDDTVTTVDATLPTLVNTGLNFTGNVSIVGDTENDTVTLGTAALADTFTSANLTVNTGVGTGAQTINLGRATVNGNASLTNGGDGLQTVNVIGAAAGTAISGDLIINQSSATNAGGYTVNVTDYNVGIVGDEFVSRVGITNGNGTGNATVTLTSNIARLFTDSVTVTNGNNASNDINVVGGAGFATLAGNIGLTNGVGTVSNSIDIDGSVLGSNTVNNRTNVSLTNGLSNNNDINLGAVNTNTVNGQFFASNNSGGSGAAPTNDITIAQGVFARNVQLTNGLNSVVAVNNTITVATLGTGVDVTGNFVASNGNTAGANTVNIGTDLITATNGLRVAQITPANGSGSGNVNISNGTTTAGAATVSIRGAAGGATLGDSTNEIDGNVSIINRGASAVGTKVITLRGLSTFGRTGVTLNNALAGISTVNVGNAAAVDPVFINGTGGLFVQDGSGASTLTVELATIGTLGTANQAGFRYQDFSGGVDTINIGNVAAGSVTVNGVTRFDTAGGSDAIVIGNTAGGSAAFNDSVFIDLGAGNDSLLIGNNAASPAFGSADKYQFNGGAGVDVVNGDQTSLSSWSTVNLNKKLKSKVTGFETKTVTP